MEQIALSSQHSSAVQLAPAHESGGEAFKTVVLSQTLASHWAVDEDEACSRRGPIDGAIEGADQVVVDVGPVDGAVEGADAVVVRTAPAGEGPVDGVVERADEVVVDTGAVDVAVEGAYGVVVNTAPSLDVAVVVGKASQGHVAAHRPPRRVGFGSEGAMGQISYSQSPS
jgi:hypothetical protein